MGRANPSVMSNPAQKLAPAAVDACQWSQRYSIKLWRVSLSIDLRFPKDRNAIFAITNPALRQTGTYVLERCIANFCSAMGQEVKNNLCPCFEYSRADLFNIIYVKKLQSFSEVMKECAKDPESIGCEVCKPAIGSIMASLFNKHVMDSDRRYLQDTNDRQVFGT